MLVEDLHRVHPIAFSVLEGPLLPIMFSIPRLTFKISHVLWKIPAAKFDQNLRGSVDAVFLFLLLQ